MVSGMSQANQRSLTIMGSPFLKLTADCLCEARGRVEDAGLNYARKAMILCGLSLDVDGIWRVAQLKPELQALVRKHDEMFEKACGREETDSDGTESDCAAQTETYDADFSADNEKSAANQQEEG